MKWYLKERDNPQLKKPYYTKLGKMPKSRAKKLLQTLYRTNSLKEYDTEEAYIKAIEELELSGHHVY